jgi:hypothetical protein
VGRGAVCECVHITLEGSLECLECLEDNPVEKAVITVGFEDAAFDDGQVF